jgi:hypothetical protein
VTTSLSPGAVAVLAPCDICGARSAVSRVFQDGPKVRMRTRRYVDYSRALCVARQCTECGCTFGTKVVMEPKAKEPVEVRDNIVLGIKRLKAAGWTLFEGDTRWSR